MKYLIQGIAYFLFLAAFPVAVFSQHKTVEIKIRQTYDNGSILLIDTTFVITDESQIDDLLDYFEARAPEVAHSPRYVIRPRTAEAPEVLDDREDARPGRLILGVYPDDGHRGGGIRVQRVIRGTAAEGAGVKEGDVITHIDGWEVNNTRELRELLSHFQLGEAVVIEYERRGETYSGMGRLTQEKPVVKERPREEDLFIPPAPVRPAPAPRPRVVVPAPAPNREKRVMLGVYPNNLSRSRARSLDYPDDRGVYISGIVSNSAAAYAGLRKGDIITRIDGQWIDNTTDLHNALKNYDPGDEVEVTVWRDGRNRTLVVRLKGKDGSYGRDERDERADRYERDQERPRVIIIPEDDRRPRETGRAYLGVYLSSSYRGGAYISGVVSDAAAEDAGLRRGDVIISLNGYEINDDDDLKAVLSRLTPGQRVEVVYTRRGEERTTSVRLGRKR